MIEEKDFLNYEKEEDGEERIIEEIKRLMEKHQGEKVRMLIQSDNPGVNSTCIEFSFEINHWDILDINQARVLIINRHNLNEGTRVDLDITRSDDAVVTIDKFDKYETIQVDGKGIWFRRK